GPVLPGGGHEALREEPQISHACRADCGGIDNPVRSDGEVLVVRRCRGPVSGIKIQIADIARRPAGSVGVVVAPGPIQLQVLADLVIDARGVHFIKRARLLAIDNVLNGTIRIRWGDPVRRHPRIDIDNLARYRIETAQRYTPVRKRVAYPASIG